MRVASKRDTKRGAFRISPLASRYCSLFFVARLLITSHIHAHLG